MGFDRFDRADFHRRWALARLSAIHHQIATPLPGNSPDSSSLEQLESEGLIRFHQSLALQKAEEATTARETLLRQVFDKSRKLALSLSKHISMTFELDDFRELLEGSGMLCAMGKWSQKAQARVLARPGCAFAKQAGSLACDYMREAMDGLVMGLGDKERLARHASVRHGDSSCVDVFFTDVPELHSENLAWGPLPDHMALELMEIAAHFQRTTGMALKLKGFREGVLFYELDASNDRLCGTAGMKITHFIREVRNQFPGLDLKDVTPQAVISEQGA